MKAETHAGFFGPHLELIARSDTVSRAIPPLWPLSSSVAVNPFLGQADKSLPQVGALMERISGTSVTMPNNWYAAQIADGSITDADLSAALSTAPDGAPPDIEALKAVALQDTPAADALPTVADLAAQVSGLDWPGLIADRIGAWAAGYFDTGQSLWQQTSGHAAFESWRIFASRDLTPEIIGLPGFANAVAQTSPVARRALTDACDALDLTPAATTTYFHQLLLGLGGWAQVARQHLWQAELGGETDPITTDMLTIRLVWEQALLAKYAPQIADRWADVRHAHEAPPAPSPSQIASGVLQLAAERAAQRALSDILATPTQNRTDGRPALQAAFCIDVRSEVFRRALESLSPDIQTLGFAGFFGLTAAHSPFASDVTEARLPVLLTPGVVSGTSAATDSDRDARLSARAARAWGRFKLAAVSSFAFVEATGPLYVGKLVRDALGQPHASEPSAHMPTFDDSFALSDRITGAAGILRAMSMTRDFAPVVLLVGHGANVVNNPHASALHCGACGGYAGDVNARLLAGLLNDPDVRTGLAEQGIAIPADTVFVAGLHDTTTDAVTLFDADAPSPVPALKTVRERLAMAGTIARTERALRLPRAGGETEIATRSRDWSETRPEWALAGCRAFIAAPRSRTRGKAFAGQAFLHDYDWREDEGFGILELILTAPVVVASWISLQYYGSVVMPAVFGAGDKLLHNVTGGVGVVEGNGGVLRTGLPWQSVHDGEGLAHSPLRLTVCVEAPEAAVTDILNRHGQVRALFDNGWLHLLLLDEAGQTSRRYTGNGTWADV